MKSTEQQLKDPQWWDDFQPKGCELLLVCNDPEGDDLWAHFNGHRYEVSLGSYSIGFVLDNYTLHRKPEHQGNNEKHDAEPKFIPEAGQWCEVLFHGGEWGKRFFIGFNSHGHKVYHNADGDLQNLTDMEARPIKPERDVFVERIESMRKSDDDLLDLLGRAYDNGARFNDD